MPLNPDDTLLNGQYRILSLLGRGGFGFVYQAQDTLLRKERAIKELIPALVGDESTLKRFLIEARATMELSHDRIVRTFNVFQEGGHYYIVMECMAGGSLSDLLREKDRLPIDEAVRIAAEVCEGLTYAHQRGIVHCDLKPANILFAAKAARSELGAAKVADFGIAHVSDQMLTRTWMTPAGYVAGTLPYMSPEQADGVRDDPRVDVYALGAVLYRMLTGRSYVEFEQRDTPGAWADNVLRIRDQEPDPPSTHNRRVPAWLDEVVLKALAKSAGERYGSTAEMQAALAAQGSGAPVPLGAPAGTAESRSRVGRHGRPTWFWLAAGSAAAVLLVVVTTVALLLFRGDGARAVPSAGPGEGALAGASSTPTASHSPAAPTRTPIAPDTTPSILAPTSTPTPPPTATDPPPTATRTPANTPTRTPTPASTRTRAPTPTPRPTVTPTLARATPAAAQPTAAPTTQASVASLSLLNAEVEASGSFAGDCIVTGRWDPEGAGITDGNLEVYLSDGTLLRVVPDWPKYPTAPNFMHFNLSFLGPGDYYAKITWHDPVHGFITAVPSSRPGLSNIVQVVITPNDCWSNYQ